MESDMPETYDSPLILHAPPPSGEEAGPFAPWPGQPHGPMPELPIDRAAILQWVHDMVEARVPDGFPLPWDHAGPCHDPAPSVTGL
jgi:hypothetical protein